MKGELWYVFKKKVLGEGEGINDEGNSSKSEFETDERRSWERCVHLLGFPYCYYYFNVGAFCSVCCLIKRI